MAVSLGAALARASGRFCGTAATSDVTDAVVAIVAVTASSILLTSDPEDLNHLLGRCQRGDRVEVRPV